MIRQIVALPDERLRSVSAPVVEITSEVRKIAGDMLDTLRKHKGAGLAAVQIGHPIRMIAISARHCAFQIMVNPEIVTTSGQNSDSEGCLSIPGKRFQVRRASTINVKFTDRADQQHVIRLEGYAARIVQHEVDHLDGKCIDTTGIQLDSERVA